MSETTELEGALATAEELELITTGRRTGKPHAVTVWFAYHDGSVWLRTDRDADWLRNLERDPRCRIRVAGIERGARREPVADESAALRRLVDVWRAKYGQEWVADWYVERGRVPVRLVLESGESGV
jgi:deazaflavin-dependent oxidoreductase (nitroreductase family)